MSVTLHWSHRMDPSARRYRRSSLYESEPSRTDGSPPPSPGGIPSAAKSDSW